MHQALVTRCDHYGDCSCIALLRRGGVERISGGVARAELSLEAPLTCHAGCAMTREAYFPRQPYDARANDAYASASDEFAAAYDAHFGEVYDVASKLGASEQDAEAIVAATFERFADGRLVAAKGGVGGRLAATAYHEAAALDGRPTQPVAAGTHGLPDEAVQAVNAHVAKCRRCRSWGPLPPSSQPGVIAPYPLALQDDVWNDIAPAPPAQQQSAAFAAAPVAAAASTYPADYDAGLAAWTDADRDERDPVRRKRWLFALAAVASVIVVGAIAGTLLASMGGRDNGGGNGNAIAGADDDKDKTVVPTATLGAGGAVGADVVLGDDAPGDANASEGVDVPSEGGADPPAADAPPPAPGDSDAESALPEDPTQSSEGGGEESAEPTQAPAATATTSVAPPTPVPPAPTATFAPPPPTPTPPIVLPTVPPVVVTVLPEGVPQVEGGEGEGDGDTRRERRRERRQRERERD